MPGPVVLVGLMGSGKTTVGRRLAATLDRPFVDADEALEERAGRSDRRHLRRPTARTPSATSRPRCSPSCSTRADAAGDRQRRRRRRCARPTASASGAPTTSPWCGSTPAPAFLASRIEQQKAHRPLLAGDEAPREVLERLHAERAPLYDEVADLVVDVEPFHEGEEQAEAGARRAHRRPLSTGRASRGRSRRVITVDVPLPGASYPVVVGAGAPRRAGRRWCRVGRAARRGRHASPGSRSRSTPAASTGASRSAHGEAAKSLATVEELCRAWAAWGLTRGDAVVAVGGGVVTDVGGLRGRELPPRDPRRARPDHAARAWSTPRSAARPA